MTDPMGLEDHREPWPNHQEQAKELDREEAARQAANDAYNKGMANSQRTMHGAHGGATSIGRAGYNTWSALQKASISAQLRRGGGGAGALGELKTLSGKTIVATHSDEYEADVEQQGPIIYPNGTVLIHSRHILYERKPDGTLRSLGEGIPMREDVGRNAIGWAGTRYTDKWGGVPDDYRVRFTGHEGYVTVPQTLFIPGLRATQNVTVYTNGSYEIEPSVITFH